MTSDAASSDATAPRRSIKRTLGSIVLGFESLVMFLAALVVFGLGALPPVPALVGGGLLCVALVATAGLLRYQRAFIAGWVLQGLILATAILVPLMVIVGAMFGGMWIYCMIRGGAIDRENAAL